MRKLINISEVSKVLNLVDPKTKKPLNHILRYWEKEFKQIKPLKINNRRYYSPEQVEIIKSIKYYIRIKGLTISGTKNLLKSSINNVDENGDHSLKASYYKDNIKLKTKTILKKINKIKLYGKKNSS